MHLEIKKGQFMLSGEEIGSEIKFVTVIAVRERELGVEFLLRFKNMYHGFLLDNPVLFMCGKKLKIGDRLNLSVNKLKTGLYGFSVTLLASNCNLTEHRTTIDKFNNAISGNNEAVYKEMDKLRSSYENH